MVGYPTVPLPIPRRVHRRCTSKLFAPSVAFTHLRWARLPHFSCNAGEPDEAAGFLNVRTGWLLAPQRDFVMTLRRSGLPFRRPPATGPLGHYPDRTHTGKSTTASPGHTEDRVDTTCRSNSFRQLRAKVTSRSQRGRGSEETLGIAANSQWQAIVSGVAEAPGAVSPRQQRDGRVQSARPDSAVQISASRWTPAFDHRVLAD